MSHHDEPYFPSSQPCLSYWQRTTRHWSRLTSGANESVPQTADVVIIGSGLSGALVAYELLYNPSPPSNVVMLEAREVCSGATARHAGHCRPDAYRGYSAYSAKHGSEQAIKILRHEKRVLQLMKTFIETHGIDCDFNYSKTVDVIMSQHFLEYVKRSYSDFDAAGGDLSDVTWLESEEAQKITRVSGALGAVEWTAATLHSVKLCQGILDMAMDLGLAIFANTTAQSVTMVRDGLWNVESSRGTITTPTVVHATNAYASSLLPFLGSIIQPLRAQAHAVIPTQAFTGQSLLTQTYSIRYSLVDFYSVAQRPRDGLIILGGANEEIQRDRLNWPDDCSVNKSIASNAIERLRSALSEWKEEAEGEGLQYGWTGILGMTPDSVPLIGAVPSLPVGHTLRLIQ
ncbi:hypothetical protein HGRIS_011151 [Hohenbuehelia grisea]|uniref:FAD dependent oxidoreductase domain-containing protein n=1 Tax=Hohenbuehelia grisea TaxID=104357 RepID=A0ABR3IZ90_9AGAR